MKKLSAIIFCLMFAYGLSVNAQSFTNGFEGASLGADGWTAAGKLVAPSTNGWCSGIATPPNGGVKCAYISTAPAPATPYAYSTGVVDTLILYRTAASNIAVNSSNIQLSFAWKGVGEGAAVLEDAMQVYIIPAAVPVTTNALSPAYKVGQVFYNGQAGWQLESLCLDPLLANGTAYRVVFVWFNDGDASAATAPVAIDDVSLTIALPTAVPPCVLNNAPANGAVGVSPCAVTFLWDPSSYGVAPNCNGAGGIAATAYVLNYSTAPGGPFTTVNTNFTSASVLGLAPSTQYYWYIAPRNFSGTNGTCIGSLWTFTTGLLPPVTVNPPVFDDMEGCGNWAFVNSGPNAWVRGTAVANGGISSMYVSNNGGTNNTYTGTTSTVIHAYNNILGLIPYFDLTAVPAGNCVSFSFDWRANGERLFGTDFDYLEVWLVPTGYTPVAGAQVVAGGGRVKLNATGLNLNSSFITQTFNMNPYIGTQFKIVFSWINDGSITGNPPAAIDNIRLISTGLPPSDVPCTASLIPAVTAGGVTLAGSNLCSVNVDEPFNSTATDPACWTNATNAQINTVWFRFTAPGGSTCARIWVKPSGAAPLKNPQIALYTSGNTPIACGNGPALTFVTGTCNDDRPDCGNSGGAEPDRSSEISTGTLNNGNYYYIAIDGLNDQTGTFSLFIMDAGSGCATPLPATPGQDCALPTPVSLNCNIFVPNPGYRNFGTNCDLNAPASCLGSGEKYSAWYQINITSAGNLMFDIVPNDYPGAPTDYDYILFRADDQGVTSCDAVNADGLCCTEMKASPGLNVRCNYSAQQVTGCFGAAGNSPPAYPGFNGAYDPQVPVLANQIYVLMVSNFAPGGGAGFSLSFANSTCGIGSFTNGSSILWTGAVSNDWANPANWSGCQVPTCTFPETNAIIPSGYVNAPTIFGIDSCRSLTINAGAVLTLAPGAILSICSDYNNQGALISQAGSRVIFEGPNTGSYPASGIQNLDGNLTGANGFHHLEVFKAGITQIVKVNQDIEIKGDMGIGVRTPVPAGTNFTSFIDVSGKYHKQGGHFIVNAVNPSPTYSTYNPGNMLEFNGGVNQNYYNRGTLNSVLMNQSAATSVTLQNHTYGTPYMNILSSTATLTFTQGKIITPGSANGFVYVGNTSPGAVNAGNATSYIENAISNNPSLSRKMTGAVGSFEFPVGTALKGYKRMSFTITSALTAATAFTSFTVGFDNTAPVTPSGVWTECGATYHTGGITPLNHGFWRVTSLPATLTGGIYTLNLYNGLTGYTNAAADQGIMYGKNSNTAANWLINPYPMSPCFTNGLNPTLRQNMSASVTFTGVQAYFGTAQSITPLPVDLLSFTATPFQSSIKLDWITASEINNKGFRLEKSLNGTDFASIAWIDGKGTTNEIHKYNYLDKDVTSGILYYYRLVQIDFNGEHSESKVVAAMLNNNGFVFEAKPNPYIGRTTIAFELQNASDVKVEVINPLGQVVSVLSNGKKEAGVYEFNFSAKEIGYASGVYTMRLILNGQIYTKRLFEHQ